MEGKNGRSHREQRRGGGRNPPVTQQIPQAPPPWLPAKTPLGRGDLPRQAMHAGHKGDIPGKAPTGRTKGFTLGKDMG